jgi:hypothetical protein
MLAPVIDKMERENPAGWQGETSTIFSRYELDSENFTYREAKDWSNAINAAYGSKILTLVEKTHKYTLTSDMYRAVKEANENVEELHFRTPNLSSLINVRLAFEKLIVPKIIENKSSDKIKVRVLISKQGISMDSGCRYPIRGKRAKLVGLLVNGVTSSSDILKKCEYGGPAILAREVKKINETFCAKCKTKSVLIKSRPGYYLNRGDFNLVFDPSDST